MGREIRRVPLDWKHPTYRDVGKECEYRYCKEGYICVADRFHPMFNRLFDDEMEKWYEEWRLWKKGKHPDQKTFPDRANMTYAEWNGGPPDPAYYRQRKWAEGEATHYQMYEDVSEGTPVSPIFASLQELEDWLVEDGDWPPAHWPQGPMSREAARAFCGTGWACSAVITGDGKVFTGVATALAMKGDKDD